MSRAKGIGLLNLNEKTALHLTSLLILSHGKSIDCPASYELLQQLKTAFKKMRQVKGATTQSMKRFPAEVFE